MQNLTNDIGNQLACLTNDSDCYLIFITTQMKFSLDCRCSFNVF